ncbi:MAG: hypothetical protein MIO92_05120 [Methanosarcinaceae archaeon]|nr:hypothetical protein [Methanosarcinaceae archaeon]
MPISKTGVVIIDTTCLKCFENAKVLEQVWDNMRTVDLQIRLSAINILEVMKTENPTIRNRLLKIIKDISEGRAFLPWPHDLIKESGKAHTRGEKYFWSGDSGYEQAVYGNSITEQDLDKARKTMNSLETDFTHMHDNARKELKPFLRKHKTVDYWDTATAFLDEVWTTESHLSDYIRGIWKKIKFPGKAPIEAILEDEVWRIFLEINGFAAFERAVQKKQPKRVHYPDLLQLVYVANNPRRIVVSSDVGFLRAARVILQHRYPNVRVEECSNFLAF